MIGFDHKSNLHVGVPTGIGTRAGSNSQFTWLQYIQGVNQQDSNGRSIAGGVPINFNLITWNTVVGPDHASAFFTSPTGYPAPLVDPVISNALFGTGGDAGPDAQVTTGSMIVTCGVTSCELRFAPFILFAITAGSTLTVLRDSVSLISFDMTAVNPAGESIFFNFPASVGSLLEVVIVQGDPAPFGNSWETTLQLYPRA